LKGIEMRHREEASHDIKILNGLIETTLDSVDGYRLAAEEAPSRSLRASFGSRVSERQHVVDRLRERVRQLGGEPEDDGSILARAHRVFLCMRDRVDEHAIIAEVDHGESYLAGKWQAALGDDDLTEETRRLINGCYMSVQRGQEEWRRWHRVNGAGAGVGDAFELAGDAAGAVA
jgi:uncharacterized protein (TIGR02284 family)